MEFKGDFFVDIHSHPTLRAYNTPVPEGNRNLWQKTENDTFDTPLSRWARMKTREIAKESQANLNAYHQGKTRVIFDSLYPVEKGFLNFRKLPSAMLGAQKADQVLRTVTGIEYHQLEALRNNPDYFPELQAQYAFLEKGQGQSPDGQSRYFLARNWSDVERITGADPDNIAVVVTIEGAHAFNSGLAPRHRKGSKATRDDLRRNIGITKSWAYAPFFVNLSHHFWNELCGHTRSFKPPIFQVFNQKEGMGKGITELGWTAVHEMLAQDNGRRILIDIKHMSVRGRRDYYRFLASYNRLNPNSKVPIICSHTGVNEFGTMKESSRKKDRLGKMKASYFHNWAINLSDEEIELIHDSGGLIGIMLDKGLLGSPGTLGGIRSMDDMLERKEAFVELIARNIFHVVEAVGKRSAWDILSLGSDYDGLITHVDLYPDAASLPQLQADLVDFIKRHQYARSLWFDYEPEELIRKVMQTNALAFMQRHF